MPLERYRAKRDFGKTPEPAPAAPRDSRAGAPDLDAPGGCGRFVVHMHRARRLHWDLRLEIGGALASWAVPKGPTLDPDVKRGAFRTEDHPIDYLDFEGVIPKGEYGAGDSICWDWGTFEPETTWDPAADLRDGELKLRLRGEKLRGRFTIVRTEPRGDDRSRARGNDRSRARGAGGPSDDGEAAGETWLLIAKRAGETTEAGDPVAGWEADAHPVSVKTGRTSDEVAAGANPRFERPAPAPLPSFDVAGSRRRPQPTTLAPMLATPGRAPFDDDDWLFEPKWDGYRTLAVVARGHVRLLTRNGNDAGRFFPELLGPPTWLMAPEAIIDGEVVAFDDEGRPDFSLLQSRLGAVFGQPEPGGGASPESRAAGRAAPLAYVAFDMPWCAGRALLDVPLELRKALLKLVLREQPRIRFASHIEHDGVAFFTAAAARGLEGMMAKHRRSRYEPGRRAATWLKLKVRPTQELIVVGFVPGQGSHRDLGALLVGVMDDGRLRSVGRVGSGIDEATRGRIRRALEEAARADMPFEAPREALADLRRTPDVRWAEPRLVIRAEIGGWTRDGNVRQATFAGVAADVEAAAVERQEAVGPAAAERALAKVGVAGARGAASRGLAVRGAMPSAASSEGARGRGVRDAMPSATSGARVAEPGAEEAHVAAGQAAFIGAHATIDPVDPAELDALDHLPPGGGAWRIAGRDLKLTNLDKVIAPGIQAGDGPDEPPVTKRDLIRYMVQAAPLLLPHLADRALNLARYPGGVTEGFFWQKGIAAGTPDWIARWKEPDPPDRKPHVYVMATEPATLGWLGNQAALEIHPWTSLVDAPWEPRWALIDIDPGERTTWEDVVTLARLFRQALEHLRVVGIPKVTGKRGIQVFIPIRPGYTFEDTRAWIEQVSRAVGGAVPDLVSWEWSKDRRGGAARLDFTQNWRNRTLVAAYSPRPAPGLPVSAPITWDELDDPALGPDRWTIRTILPRVATVGDLFAGALGPGQELPKL